MPRAIRSEYATGVFHVMGRCVPELRIFELDAAKQRFLRDLALSIRKFAAELYAYCVMTNHYHLLIGTEAVPIGRIMQTPTSHIAQRWNWEHERKGPVWDDRFKSPPIETESYFLNAARYIEYNPVAAGIVAFPEEYPWSSCRTYLSGIDDNLITATKLLAAAGIGYGSWLSSESGSWPHEGEPEWFGDPAQAPTAEQKLERLFAFARKKAQELGSTLESVLSRSKLPVDRTARRAVVERAAASGYSGADIARILGRSEATISEMLALGRKNPKVGV